jgi:hypothetical protein
LVFKISIQRSSVFATVLGAVKSNQAFVFSPRMPIKLIKNKKMRVLKKSLIFFHKVSLLG